MPTGAINGFFVVDLDVKAATANKPARDGFASLEKLEQENVAAGGEPLPNTIVVRRGEGAHLYFDAPPGVYIKTSGGELGEGIDIRGDGGYVVAPDSPHKSGSVYTILDESAPLAKAPEWLLKLVTASKPTNKLTSHESVLKEKTGADLEKAIAEAKIYLAKSDPCIEDGTSSAKLMKYAGVLRASGIPFNTCLDLLKEFDKRCVPPWGEVELDRALDNAGQGPIVAEKKAIAKLFERAKAWGDPLPEAAQVAAPGSKASAEEGLAVFDFHEGGWDIEEPEIPYLVEGLIPSGTVGMLVAPGESLKSWILVSLLLAIAAGGKWLGHFQVQQGRSYYIDYESDRGEAKRRLRILKAGAAPGFVYANTDYNLPDDVFWQNLPADGRLYVIDSLSEGQPAVDENSTLASMPLKLARRISRATGAVFIFLHHVNKGEGNARDKIRGSTTLFNASDFVYGVDTQQTCENGSVTAKVFKIKMKRAKAPKPFTVVLSDTSGLQLVGDPNAPVPEEPPDTWARSLMLKALRAKKEGMTRTQLSESAGRNKQRGLSLIKDLERDGVVVEIDRLMHLDDREARTGRILTVMEKLAHTRKIAKKAVCDLARVLPSDFEKLELMGVLVKTEHEGYVVDPVKAKAVLKPEFFKTPPVSRMNGVHKTAPEALVEPPREELSDI